MGLSTHRLRARYGAWQNPWHKVDTYRRDAGEAGSSLSILGRVAGHHPQRGTDHAATCPGQMDGKLST